MCRQRAGEDWCIGVLAVNNQVKTNNNRGLPPLLRGDSSPLEINTVFEDYVTSGVPFSKRSYQLS